MLSLDPIFQPAAQRDAQQHHHFTQVQAMLSCPFAQGSVMLCLVYTSVHRRLHMSRQARQYKQAQMSCPYTGTCV